MQDQSELILDRTIDAKKYLIRNDLSLVSDIPSSISLLEEKSRIDDELEPGEEVKEPVLGDDKDQDIQADQSLQYLSEVMPQYTRTRNILSTT